MDEKIRPGVWLYWLAGFILAAGITVFVVLLVTSIAGIGGAYKQVVVPGRVELTLENKGTYNIFHEYRSVVGNKIYDTDKSINGLKCMLTKKSTSESIPLSVPFGNSNYEIDGREGNSVFEFTIDEPGTYELSAYYDGNQDGPETVLAVGQGFFSSLIFSILGGIGIVFASVISSLIIFITTYRKRIKYKKELQRGYY